MDKNYVHVGNIIEQERVRRQAQISKGIVSEVYDHIEKAHNDDLNDHIEKSENLTRFETDIQDLNKAETELLLHKIQRQLNADSESTLLKAMKSIAINHYNDIEKAKSGVYADTAENRRWGRVGMKYGPEQDKIKKERLAVRKSNGEVFKNSDFAEKYLKDVKEVAFPEAYKKSHPNEKGYEKTLSNGDIIEMVMDDFNTGIEIRKREVRADGGNGTYHTPIKSFDAADKNAVKNAVKFFNNYGNKKTVKKAEENDIEKAGHGIYEDNAENRRLNRVGQEYGHAAEQKEPTNKQPKNQEEAGGGLQAHAAKASDEALKRAAADEKAKPEVREAAKKELANRGVDKSKKTTSVAKNTENGKTTDNEINIALSKMTFNGDEVRWPADLDISKVQKKYGFDLDDVFLDEKKNQFIGHAVKYDSDSSGKPSSKPYDAEQELGGIQAKLAKSLKRPTQSNSDGESNAMGDTTIHGKGVNYEFVSGIKRGDARKILQEAGFKNDMGSNNVSKVYLSDDGKSVKIDYDNKEGKTKTAEIAIGSDKSETLNKLYGEFSEEMTAVFDDDEPGKLDKKTLGKYINAELKNFWDKNNTDNDSSDWREGAYQIYKKYSKDNPMSAEKFDHEFASKYQGASEGKKMSFYFSARENGGDESEAENYADTEYKALMRHLNDPRMSRTKFEPIPFS